MLIATGSHIELFLATLLLVAATVSALPAPILSYKKATTQPFAESVATTATEKETTPTEKHVGELTTTAVEEAANETISQEEVMNFLERYGYLSNHTNNNTGPAASTDISEPLKLMQRYAGIAATGRVDEATRRAMRTPRCGVKDEIERLVGRYRTVSRWNKHYLRYKVVNYPRYYYEYTYSTMAARIAESFEDWSRVADLTFDSTRYNDADIKISFEERYHGDKNFDGRGGTLAHASYPMVGLVHMDNEEIWTSGKTPPTGAVDLRQVLTHELGHALGLAHSTDRNAVMYPYYEYRSNFYLGADDIQGMRALYGAKGTTTRRRNLFTTSRRNILTTRPYRNDGVDTFIQRLKNELTRLLRIVTNFIRG